MRFVFAFQNSENSPQKIDIVLTFDNDQDLNVLICCHVAIARFAGRRTRITMELNHGCSFGKMMMAYSSTESKDQFLRFMVEIDALSLLSACPAFLSISSRPLWQEIEDTFSLHDQLG